MDVVNKKMMASEGAIKQYSFSTELTKPEASAVLYIANEARDRPILDIGVGAGRTVKGLTTLSRDYLGIDYTPEMIDKCKERYPEHRFEHADARDLKNVKTGSIFLAMFSCNGLGMVSHDDRLAILREVRRVLEPGGAFLFSTHNLASNEAKSDFRLPEIDLSSRNPARLLMRLSRFARQTATRFRNRRKLRPLETRGDGYAMLNDACHDYGVMLYYVDLVEQERQLKDTGFEKIEAYWDLSGKVTTTACTDESVMVLARTPVTSPA